MTKNIAMFLAAAGMAVATAPAAFAQSASTEVARDGTCPNGFAAKGDTCVSKSGAVALKKVGSSCPTGFKTSQKYCVGDKGDYAEVRSGSCSGGMKTSGQYCVK